MGSKHDLQAGLAQAEEYTMEDMFMAYIDRERARETGPVLGQGQ